MQTSRRLLHEKTVKLLLALKGRELYLTSLARESGLTYAYVAGIISDFEKEGIVSTKKEGRERRISLAEKGDRLSFSFQEILNLLREEQKKEEMKPQQ